MVDLDKAGPSRRTLWPGMLLINGMKPLGKRAMTDINAQQEVRNALLVLGGCSWAYCSPCVRMKMLFLCMLGLTSGQQKSLTK